MKKNSVVILISAIAIVILVLAVTEIEKKSKTPMDRFLETLQTAKQTEEYIPAKIIDNDGGLQYEFLSYDLIDDKDIETQTKYKAEYFYDGKVPSSDYVVKWTDFDAMARDYPKFDEWRKGNYEKGMTDAEYEEFIRIHEPEYTIDKHVKTKYYFIRCRITYIGGDVFDTNEKQVCLFDFVGMAGDKKVVESNPDCFFDHPQNTEGDERRKHFFVYKFGKIGDSIECVVGGRLREDHHYFSEATAYYVGFHPGVTYSDEDQFNPALDSKFVALKDMPKEP